MWTRTIGGELRARFDDEVIAGEIATCAMVKLELLYSARKSGEFALLKDELDALPQCQLDASGWDRALATYGDLAALGGLHQRSVRHPDLLIATAAEAAGLAVLHYRRGLRTDRCRNRTAGRMACTSRVAGFVRHR